MLSPFPHIAQIIKCTRLYCPTQKGAEPEMAVRLFGTSHKYGSKTAAQTGKMIREHWSVENLNHPPSVSTFRPGSQHSKSFQDPPCQIKTPDLASTLASQSSLQKKSKKHLVSI